MLGEIQRGHAVPFREVIVRAQHRGELAREVDPGTVAATLIGPLFYRRWFSREPIDEAFTSALIRHATEGEPLAVAAGRLPAEKRRARA